MFSILTEVWVTTQHGTLKFVQIWHMPQKEKLNNENWLMMCLLTHLGEVYWCHHFKNQMDWQMDTKMEEWILSKPITFTFSDLESRGWVHCKIFSTLLYNWKYSNKILARGIDSCLTYSFLKGFTHRKCGKQLTASMPFPLLNLLTKSPPTLSQVMLQFLCHELKLIPLLKSQDIGSFHLVRSIPRMY